MLAVEMTALKVIFGGLASVRQTKRKARGRDGNAACANEAGVPINGNKRALNVRCRMRPVSPSARHTPITRDRVRHDRSTARDLGRKQNPGTTDSNTYNWETDSRRKGRVSGTKRAITAPEFFFAKQMSLDLFSEPCMKLEILQQAVLDSRDGITISDNLVGDNPLIFVNPAFERMTGYSSEEITNVNCRYLQNDDREQTELKIVKNAIEAGQYCLVIVRNYRKDGTMFWNELSISPIFDANGVVTNFIGIQKDVTARVLIQQQLRDENKSFAEIRVNLEQLAIKDGLTGIYNRRFFDVQLEIQWRIARRNNEPLTLIMIDVDHFKQFNDIYGHNAGDDALKLIADCLNKSFLRSSDFVARYGGDEFVVLSVGMTQEQAALFTATLCQRVRDLGIPHSASSTGYITVSIGFSVHAPLTHDHSSVLLGRADKALYAAKQRGRDQSFSL